MIEWKQDGSDWTSGYIDGIMIYRIVNLKRTKPMYEMIYFDPKVKTPHGKSLGTRKTMADAKMACNMHHEPEAFEVIKWDREGGDCWRGYIDGEETYFIYSVTGGYELIRIAPAGDGTQLIGKCKDFVEGKKKALYHYSHSAKPPRVGHHMPRLIWHDLDIECIGWNTARQCDEYRIVSHPEEDLITFEVFYTGYAKEADRPLGKAVSLQQAKILANEHFVNRYTVELQRTKKEPDMKIKDKPPQYLPDYISIDHTEFNKIDTRPRIHDHADGNDKEMAEDVRIRAEESNGHHRFGVYKLIYTTRVEPAHASLEMHKVEVPGEPADE